MQVVIIVVHTLFLSTLSLRRATARRASRQQPAGISIHALLAESDFWNSYPTPQRWLFLSTLSLRRATKHLENRAQDLAFLSTLSLRRATIFGHYEYITAAISIHALLAESDLFFYAFRF